MHAVSVACRCVPKQEVNLGYPSLESQPKLEDVPAGG